MNFKMLCASFTNNDDFRTIAKAELIIETQDMLISRLKLQVAELEQIAANREKAINDLMIGGGNRY